MASLVEHRQGFVGALAGEAGEPSLIGISRKLTRSLVKPLTHERKQIGGGAGCFAAAGSAGIRAGLTGGGGELTGALLQADSRSISSAQVSLEGEAGKVFSIEGLL
jgi:hypothetical protein